MNRQHRNLAGTLAAAALVLLGAGPVEKAPPEQVEKARKWQRRTQADIEDLAEVGVDTRSYKEAWIRADQLLGKGMVPEGLRAFRYLAADLEGWNPSPPPPRMPADALMDERDPRAGKVRVLAGPRGYGRWRAPGLREKLEANERGEYHRPLSGDSPPGLGERIRHQKIKERVRASHTAAARRWQVWHEEADDPEGMASGKLVSRPGGGQVLRYERPEVPAPSAALEGPEGVGGYRPAGGVLPAGGAPSALPEALGVGSYRNAGNQALVADVAATPPLTGSAGVGAYGHPLRVVRKGLGRDSLPHYSVPPPDWPGNRASPPEDNSSPGASGSPLGEISGPDDLDFDDGLGLGEPQDTGPGDPGTDFPGDDPLGDSLGDDLEGDGPGENPAGHGFDEDDPVDDLDDLGDDPIGDGDLDDDLAGGLDDGLDGGLGGGSPGGPPEAVSVADLRFRQGELAGRPLRLEGRLGRKVGILLPHVERLAEIDSMDGRMLISLEDGAAQVDVLAERGWVENLGAGTEVRVEGVLVFDPQPLEADLARLILADSVAPL